MHRGSVFVTLVDQVLESQATQADALTPLFHVLDGAQGVLLAPDRIDRDKLCDWLSIVMQNNLLAAPHLIERVI
jgi:hypothetical protein